MSAIAPEKSVQAPQQPPPIQTTAPVQKNNKLLKVAIIGLVIMLIIILSEVGYLIFSGYGRTYFQLKSDSQNETAAIPASLPTPISTPSVEFSPPKNSIQSSKVDNFLYILEALESKESFIEAVTVNSTFKAIVTSTSQDGIKDRGFRYIINAKNDQGQTIGFRFSIQEIDSAEISLNNEEISFGDIKPDDILTVKVISDLLDNSLDSKLILEIERDD